MQWEVPQNPPPLPYPALLDFNRVGQQLRTASLCSPCCDFGAPICSLGSHLHPGGQNSPGSIPGAREQLPRGAGCRGRDEDAMAKLLVKLQRYFRRKPVRFFTLLALYLTAGSLVFLHSGFAGESTVTGTQRVPREGPGLPYLGVMQLSRGFKAAATMPEGGRRHGPWFKSTSKEPVERGKAGDHSSSRSWALRGRSGREKEEDRGKGWGHTGPGGSVLLTAPGEASCAGAVVSELVWLCIRARNKFEHVLPLDMNLYIYEPRACATPVLRFSSCAPTRCPGHPLGRSTLLRGPLVQRTFPERSPSFPSFLPPQLPIIHFHFSIFPLSHLCTIMLCVTPCWDIHFWGCQLGRGCTPSSSHPLAVQWAKFCVNSFGPSELLYQICGLFSALQGCSGRSWQRLPCRQGWVLAFQAGRSQPEVCSVLSGGTVINEQG